MQGRPGGDGGQPRDAGAIPRPSRRRARRAHSGRDEGDAGRGKQILRRLVYREVPAALLERPKAGFAVPVGEWIKGPLRDWAEALLDPGRLREEGYFDPDIVQRRWRRHLLGEQDSTAALWAILMFQAWLEEPANAAASELPAPPEPAATAAGGSGSAPPGPAASGLSVDPLLG